MLWAIAFIEAGWHVTFMEWPAFLERVMSQNFEFFRHLPAHLIVGGFSLATDYM